MPDRDAIPLYKTRHVYFVEAASNHPRFDRRTAGLLHIGTGVRPDTLCHIHSSWFRWKPPFEMDAPSERYTDRPALYLQVPPEDPCRKSGDHTPCGDCNLLGHDNYEVKTKAGEGREILLDDMWTNPVTKEREYFPLRDVVKSYFAHTGEHAPDDAAHGEEMIGGNGISKGTLNNWHRDIATRSDMSAKLREDQLRKWLTSDDNDEGRKINEQIKQRTTNDGTAVPDLFSHDMRASFCTQLMRNNTAPEKAITKTGHKTPEAMETYIGFAQGEIDSGEETMMY